MSRHTFLTRSSILFAGVLAASAVACSDADPSDPPSSDVASTDDPLRAGGGSCRWGDGLYCGGDGIAGDRGTLYRCRGGALSVVETCARGCTHAPPGVDDACTSTETNVRIALAYGRSLVGTRYGWWFSGPIPKGAPMWAAAGPAPAPATVLAQSANCSGLMNLLLRSVGKSAPGAGGTGAYGSVYANVAHRFDHTRTSYPAGTLIGRYYRDVYDQGHVAVVLPNGHVLQSYANAFGGTDPGVNARWTVAESDAGYFYEYYVLPRDWLGAD